MVSKELARSGGLAACSACDVVLFVRRETAAALSPGQELLQNFSQKIGPFAAVLDGLPDSRWFVEERAIGLQLRYMTDLLDWDGLHRAGRYFCSITGTHLHFWQPETSRRCIQCCVHKH